MHTQVCNDLAELRAEDTQLLYQGLHTFHAHLDKTVAALRLEWREAKLARQECDLTWTMAGGGGGGTLGASVRMPSDTQHGLTLGHALGQGDDCALEGSPSRLESARLEALAQKVEAVAAEVGGVREEGSARVSAVESALRQLPPIAPLIQPPSLRQAATSFLNNIGSSSDSRPASRRR